MKVGACLGWQNPGRARPDADVWADEMRFIDMVEPLGFESLWCTEHHFSDYQIIPDPLQLLSYAAGRTTHITLATMAVIAPWHDPVRLAEQVLMLDQLSGGRFLVGIGRGLGRNEFEGLRIPMGEARQRFREMGEILNQALETGEVGYHGEIFNIPSRQVRPLPSRSFAGRKYAAVTSADTLPIAAELGCGLLSVLQKPWKNLARDIVAYRDMFVGFHGFEPPDFVASSFVICDADPVKARDLAHEFIANRYYQSLVEHYELTSSHFTTTPGYEQYSKNSEALNQHGTEAAGMAFMDQQVWGTPADCIEKALALRDHVGCNRLNANLGFAGMTWDHYEANAVLFARQVLPTLQRDEALPKAN